MSEFASKTEKKETDLPRFQRSTFAMVVLVAGLILTGLTAYFAHRSERLSVELRFLELSDEVHQSIRSRLQIYLNATLQTRGVLQINPNLTRRDFRTYLRNMNLQVEYPGIMGIGYTARVRSKEKRAFEESIRKDYNNPNLHFWGLPNKGGSVTALTGEDLFVVRFFEPEMAAVDGRNVVGFISNSDPRRASFLQSAMETGSPTLSPRLQLVQDPGKSQPGYILAVPIYERGVVLETPEQRKAAHVGFVYTAFRAHDLFEGIFRRGWLSHLGIDIRVFEGHSKDGSLPSDDSMIYAGASKDGTPSLRLNNSKIYHFEIGSRPLTLYVYSLPDFGNPAAPVIPIGILIAGFTLSLIAYRILGRNHMQAIELSKSENQLRLVTDSLPALVAYIDKSHTYQFVNRTHTDWFPEAGEQLVGQHMHHSLGMKNFHLIRPYIDRALAGESFTFENSFEMPDGSLRPFRASLMPDMATRGVVRGVVALISDTTEQKRQEQRNRFLAEKGAALSATLDADTLVKRCASLMTPSLADLCVIDLIDNEGDLRRVAVSCSVQEKLEIVDRITLFPPSFEENDGVAKAIKTGEAILQTDFAEFDSSRLGRGPEHLKFIQELGPTSCIFLPLRARNRVLGSISLVSLSPKRRFNEDDLEFASQVARRAALHIDNAQLYSEAQRANRAKDEFLATLSHELRTPMNVILGWLEILSTESVDEATFKQALDTLNRNAQVQIQLINDLLDVSRIVSGKLNLNPIDMDLAQVTSQSVEAVLPTARTKGIQLKTEIETSGASPSPFDFTFSGDADRIQQILWNLLNNAIKFTPDGGNVWVRLHAFDTSFSIEVEDSGRGIEPHFLPYVFDRFRQEDGSMTRIQGGLGLGLSIVRYLVELHGGSISAHSDGKGQGAKFTVTLPRRTHSMNTSKAASPAPRLATASLAEDRRSQVLHGVRILLVDDSVDVRALVSRILERVGATVTSVEAASEAYQEITKHRPDIFISDIGLPEEDGLSLMKRIREYEKASGQSPVPSAALTAYAQVSDTERAMEAGFTRHISKPVTSTALLETIAELAGRKPSSKFGTTLSS